MSMRTELIDRFCTPFCAPFHTRFCALFCILICALLGTTAEAAEAPDCGQTDTPCLSSLALTVAPAAELQFYVWQESAEPDRLVVAIHGHSHDANTTLEATVKALEQVAPTRALVVAPIFQVDAQQSGRCHTPGVPAASAGEPQWTCSSWSSGEQALNRPITSFAALDQLIEHLLADHPSIHAVTLAGFSAGAQFVQRYVVFGKAPRVNMHFVVADPGSWVYFDDVRPVPTVDGETASWNHCDPAHGLAPCKLAWERPTSCAGANRWKYGLEGLDVDTEALRKRYARASIDYLEGALDAGRGPGTAARVLDQSCPAMAQGPDRLTRGVAYTAYDQQYIGGHPLHVVPGCAHSVACVFPTRDGARALLGTLDASP